MAPATRSQPVGKQDDERQKPASSIKTKKPTRRKNAKRLTTSIKGEKTTQAKKSIGFLDLPFELRLMIYRFCLPNGEIFDLLEKPIFSGNAWMRPGNYFTIFNPHSSDPYFNSEGANHSCKCPDCGEVHTRSDDSDENENQNSDDSDAEVGADSDGVDSTYGNDVVIDAESDSEDGLPPKDTWTKDGTADDLTRLKTMRGLLVACRQVREESLDVLYGENVFAVNILGMRGVPDLESMKRLIKEGKNCRIQHVMLAVLNRAPFSLVCEEYEIQPCRHYCHLSMPADIWNPFLTNLKTLRIVVDSPRLPFLYDRDPDAPGHYSHCRYAQSILGWEGSIKRLLKFVGEIVPSNAPASTMARCLAQSDTKRTVVMLDKRGCFPESVNGAFRIFLEKHAKEVRTILGNRLDWQREDHFLDYVGKYFQVRPRHRLMWGMEECVWCNDFIEELGEMGVDYEDGLDFEIDDLGLEEVIGMGLERFLLPGRLEELELMEEELMMEYMDEMMDEVIGGMMAEGAFLRSL